MQFNIIDTGNGYYTLNGAQIAKGSLDFTAASSAAGESRLNITYSRNGALYQNAGIVSYTDVTIAGNASPSLSALLTSLGGIVYASGGSVPAGTYLELDKNAKQIVKAADANGGVGQSPRQIVFGQVGPQIDASGIAMGAIIVLDQDENSNGENPCLDWLTSSNAGGTANGMFRMLVGDGGKVHPLHYSKSNYGEANGFEPGSRYVHSVAEDPAYSSVRGFRFELRNYYTAVAATYATAKSRMYHSGGTWTHRFTNPTTSLLGVQNNDLEIFDVRALGDIHHGGVTIAPVRNVSGDTTLTLSDDTVFYTGPGSNTFTLPDPTNALYKGAEYKLINIGSGTLTLSLQVWKDALTPVTTLDWSDPDNRLRIKSDGAKWWKI